MLHILIIGAGEQGTALIELFHEDPETQILGVVDHNPKAKGLVLAKQLKIPTHTAFKSFLLHPDLNQIIDTSEDKTIREALAHLCPPHVEVIGGRTVRMLLGHIRKRETHQDRLQNMLHQYQAIYDLGLQLSSAHNLERVLFHTLENATALTHTHMGSIAIYDEVHSKMRLSAAKGFSARFSEQAYWNLRKGGMTHEILNRKEPLVIEDLKAHPAFQNPVVMQEGVCSLVAVPLIAERKIIGALYVNDTQPRKFTEREVSLLTLLGNIAANTIDKAQMLEHAVAASMTDELTGLYNYRYFMQRLEIETKHALRYHRMLSLAMIDIDDFKCYNDAQGHPAGNMVLQTVSGILKKGFREVDVVARFGGEEFAILMSETSSAHVKNALDRVRNAVTQYPFDGCEKQPKKYISISIGVAVYPGISNVHKLIEYADAALYRAKHQGKNCVVMGGDPSAGSKRLGGTKMAWPTRTQVAPSSMATSKSEDIPIEK